MEISESEIKAAAKKLAKKAKVENVFSMKLMASEFLMKQPLFYNRNGTFWIWDVLQSKWLMTDEIDILNLFSEKMNFDTTKSHIKNELINSLKQLGRQHIPKDPERNWLQFQDTIIDISNGNKFKATAEYFITNPIPYPLGNTESTPTMDKLFGEWVVKEGLQDESYIQTLYEIIAYCCSNEQFLQTIIALTGSGSNGKGTFLNLICKFLGEQNICSSDLKTLSTRNFEASALYRKLLCVMGEVDAHDLKNTGLLKKLTGEDLVRYEFKGKTPFSEYSSTTCVISTNSLPLTPDKSIGFYRRWLIVDFPNQFKIKRNLIKEIPDQEFPNLALKIVRILSELYKKNEFTNGGTIEQKTQRYEARSNPLAMFLQEYCNDTTSGKIKIKEFCEQFNTYLKNHRLRPVTTRKVGNILREEGFEISARNFAEDGNEVSAKAVLGIDWKNLHSRDMKNSSSSGSFSGDHQLPELPEKIEVIKIK